MTDLAEQDRLPRAASVVRLVGTACALLVAAAVAFVVGWWPLGIVLAIVAVLMVAACVGLGAFLVRVTLRAHANGLATLGHGGAKRAPRTGLALDEEQRAERRRVDAQVGFLLRVDDPPMGGELPEADRARIRENRLAERAAVSAWLDGLPQGWQEVHAEAQDGASLAGFLLEANPGSSRWVILAHGYGGNHREMMLYARGWAQRGFNLLAPDMRGHGESGGPYIGMGWLDRRDLVAWACWLVQSRGADVQICLHGHSMGGSAVCLAAGEADLPAQVRAIVSDCAFTSAWEALASMIEGGAGLPVHPTLDLVRLNLMARRGGYDLAHANALPAVGRARVPMLFVHGEGDELVPPAMSRKLHDACASAGSELLMVPGAGHCQAALSDPPAYWAAVDRLLATSSVR